MRYGLVDAGNSRLKAGIADGDSIIRTAVFSYDDMDSLSEFLSRSDIVAISSVRGDFDPGIPEKRILRLGYDNSLVRLNYAETLGSDRIAKAHFARFSLGELSLIIDFGTATVIDLAGEEFYGGVILPGAGLWLSSLGKGTHLLPDVRLKKVESNMGHTTDEAILAGLFEGIKAIVSHFSRIYPHRVRVATGGFYPYFREFLHDFVHEPFAVIRGLYEWVKRV